MSKVTITYRVRTFIDRFRCIDRENKITLFRTWESGGLLYGYKDRFNVVTIAKEDIISIVESTVSNVGKTFNGRGL